MENPTFLSLNGNQLPNRNPGETIIRHLDMSVIPKEHYFEERDFDQVLEDGEKRKPRRKICGAFVYEDTTTLLFSRTNYGKSLLVFQFAYAAATGSHFDPCDALHNECEPMKVLVVDLELDDLALSERHKAVKVDRNPYLSNLRYAQEKIENRILTGFELLDKIEEAAVAHEAKLVIIDNISKLLPDALKPDTSTMIVAVLNRIRIRTGASVVVIGHTTKGTPLLSVQPSDYYGSAMLQNFFNEVSFLDRTKDGNYFLCHSKTKHKECYTQTVPVFSLGDHHRVGYGFTFLNLQNLADVQLPYTLESQKTHRSRNLSEYRDCVDILLDAGKTQKRIAAFSGFTPAAINYLIRCA